MSDQPLPVDKHRLEGMLTAMLEAARRGGATQAEAALSLSEGLSVSARMGEVETLEHIRDRGLAVTVYRDGHKGSASTSRFDEGAIQETVDAALAIARHTAEDPAAGLAPADRMAEEIPDLDLYHPWALSADEAIERALECEQAAFAVDSSITNSEGAGVESHAAYRMYGNTHGFLGGYPATRHTVSCAVIGQGDAGGMERDYWYTTARNAVDLDAVANVGRIAAERTVRRLDPKQLKTCQVPVLFNPQVAASLLAHLVGAIRGGTLYRRASFLVDRLGEPIFPEFVRIHEQPRLPRGLGSAPFDNEGVGTQARDLVAGGRLQSYVLDSYSARKLRMETTGNAGGVRNLTIEPGREGFDELLRRMDRGLVVTELMGQGVNLVTGDYSRGAAGFWVQHGEIQYPVSELTIAGNLEELFRNLVAIGNDVDTRGNTRTGSLLLAEMTVAGQ